MMRLLCWLGLHQWRPTSTFTCNPHDTGYWCRRCYREAKMTDPGGLFARRNTGVKWLLEKWRARRNLRRAQKWAEENGRPLGPLLRIDEFRDGKKFRVYELPATDSRPSDVLFVPD